MRIAPLLYDNINEKKLYRVVVVKLIVYCDDNNKYLPSLNNIELYIQYHY